MPDAPMVFAVIDDDPAIRRLFGGIIRSMGDTVIEAATVGDARLLLAEYPWDIALIDRRLPDGDGVELCRAAAAAAAINSHRHVVIISAVGAHDDKLRGFDAGADDYIVKPIEPFELRARLKALRRAAATHKLLLSRVAALEQLSVIDGLTHVYNHRFFESELRRTTELAVRHGRPLALLMIDVDHFKRVNDSYGHRAGDLVLTDVSTAIAQSVRSSDIVARYGGEEFAVILPETALADAVPAAERLRMSVAEMPIDHSAGTIHVTVSIGVAAIPATGVDSAARLIEASDRALYLAKSGGRNRVAVDESAVRAAQPIDIEARASASP